MSSKEVSTRTVSVFKIAIVDADDASACGEGAIEFDLGMNFDERLHVEFPAESEQVPKKRIVKRGNNEQKTVGIVGAGLPHLPGIEDKIFAQRRAAQLPCAHRANSSGSHGRIRLR